MKRFWCKIGEVIALDEEGFLLDPELRNQIYKKTDVVSFGDIDSIKCLILLGEPGVGKSSTVKNEINGQIDNRGNQFIQFNDISEYGDENRLIDKVFDSELIREWKNTDRNLYLFIDGYDECILNLNHLPKILIGQLELLHEVSNRLYLRIICRSGLWTESITHFLKSFFGDDNFGSFQIAPLRKVDIEDYARHNSIDPEYFIEEIKRKEIQSIAIQPVTLKSLLNEFKNNNGFVQSNERIFYSACKELCLEPKYERSLYNRFNSLSTGKSVAIASRIAAVMIFCNKSFVDVRNVVSDFDASIVLDDLEEGEEMYDHFKFDFDQNAVKTVITETALFHKKSEFLYAISSLALMEFLAAKFIASHQLEVEQIKSLITLSSDEEGKIVPQIKGTASWLSTISQPLTEYTIERDPQNLLYSDVENLDYENIAKLVDSLLHKFDNNAIDDFDWGLHKKYKKLWHPGLEEQIKEFLYQESTPLGKRFAIDLAIECGLAGLNDSLLSIAFSKEELTFIRAMAIRALSSLGEDEDKKKLIDFVGLEEDVNDELKGYSLQALWPALLETNQVFQYITPPKRKNYFGSYLNFLLSFIYQIKKEDINDGLRWISKTKFTTESNFYFEEISDVIISKAWRNLENINVKEFAKILLHRIENYEQIFPSTRRLINENYSVNVSTASRHKMLDKLIDLVDLEKVFLLSHSQLVVSEDFDKVCQKYREKRSEEKKLKLAKVLNHLFDISNIDNVENVLKISQVDEIFKNEFSYWVEPVELGSEIEETQRRAWENRKKWMQEDQKRKESLPSKNWIKERLKKDIRGYESTKNPIQLSQFFMDLTLTENSPHYGNELTSNVIELESWNLLNDEQIESLLELSMYYIKENSDFHKDWFGSNKFNRLAAAGYKALILIYKKSRNFINNLDSQIWKKWVHIIISYPETYGLAGQDKTYLSLIECAYQLIPEETISVLLKLILIADKNEDKHIFILRKFDKCFDSRLENSLLELIDKNELSINTISSIFDYLLSKNSSKAAELNKALIQKYNGKDQLELISSYASHCDSNGWDFITEIIYKEADLGKEFFLSYVDTYSITMEPLLHRISEQQCAELFDWLLTNFPMEEDPDIEGAHMVGSRESVGNFRDSIKRYLIGKGTKESVAALELIRANNPSLNLDAHLIEARRQFRKLNWRPLSPKEFLLLANNKMARVIFNEDDLVNLIEISLKQLESILQGDNPLSITLWDKVPDEKRMYTPKPEEVLSDVIKRHLDIELKSKGISSYREVQLRRPNLIKGGKKGERTDILVSFHNPNNNETLEVIIEVKGSNNKEVLSNMNLQLKERYLKEGGRTHGIYLVAWYNCESYHNQVNKTSSNDISEARDYFSEEATKLSDDSKKIKSFVLDCSLMN